jgi:uncharacterized protein YyaL (SSP411 family)
MIPHFEKMLYDNGQLLQVFAQAWRLTGKRLYRDAVDGIVDWLEADMRSPEGAFYAALDADSEGVEGKYYLWQPEEVEPLVGEAAYPAFAYRFGLDQGANFEGEWHLHDYHGVQQTLDSFSLPEDDYRRQHRQLCQRLLEVRAARVPPGLDDKLLTSWNALAIRGLASAARVFVRPDYFEIAIRCLRALRAECWHDGRLLALGKGSGKHLPGYRQGFGQAFAGLPR